MKSTKRFLATVGVIILTLIVSYFCVEMASTSYGLSVDGRRTALTGALIVLLTGGLSLILIWLPWKKWFN